MKQHSCILGQTLIFATLMLAIALDPRSALAAKGNQYTNQQYRLKPQQLHQPGMKRPAAGKPFRGGDKKKFDVKWQGGRALRLYHRERAQMVFGQLKRALWSRGGPAIFDFDGTLVHKDVGLAFFRWMIKKGHYPEQRHAMLKRRWRQYKEGSFSSEKLYELMATAMEGMQEERVKKLARTFFRTKHRQYIYRPMLELIRGMNQVHQTLDRRGQKATKRAMKRARESAKHQHSPSLIKDRLAQAAGQQPAGAKPVVPWINSGSPWWVVAAGARYFGIPDNHVIGLRVKVVDGVMTDQIEYPVPWKAGKVAQIRRQIGEQPVFGAGDSAGDTNYLRQLLKKKKPALLVNPSPELLKLLEGYNPPVIYLNQGHTIWM